MLDSENKKTPSNHINLGWEHRVWSEWVVWRVLEEEAPIQSARMIATNAGEVAVCHLDYELKEGWSYGAMAHDFNSHVVETVKSYPTLMVCKVVWYGEQDTSLNQEHFRISTILRGNALMSVYNIVRNPEGRIVDVYNSRGIIGVSSLLSEYLKEEL